MVDNQGRAKEESRRPPCRHSTPSIVITYILYYIIYISNSSKGNKDDQEVRASRKEGPREVEQILTAETEHSTRAETRDEFNIE